MQDNEYQCAECGGIFEKGWSDEEAAAEASVIFPGMTMPQMALVCDDCYNALMGHKNK